MIIKGGYSIGSGWRLQYRIIKGGCRIGSSKEVVVQDHQRRLQCRIILFKFPFKSELNYLTPLNPFIRRIMQDGRIFRITNTSLSNSCQLLKYQLPYCHVPKLAGYQIVKLPNCKVIDHSYQIVRIPNCQLPNCQVTKLSSYKIVQIPNFQPPYSQIPKCQLPNCQLPKCKLPNCQLPNVQLPNCQVTMLNLPSCQLPNVSWQIVGLANCQLPNYKLPNIRPSSVPQFSVQRGQSFKPKMPSCLQLIIRDVFSFIYHLV